MLDPRLYRAAFAPILLALVVAAFSLVDRPRPLQTTLAPDAFDGARAFATLQGLATQFPDRRPGSPGDVGLARSVERAFRAAFCPAAGAAGSCPNVSVRAITGHTIDGERDIETVLVTRLGAPGPGIMVVAHRDAAGQGAEAELSGTAGLLELARVFGGRRTQRTLTLASTSGGSGGAAGARQLAAAMPSGDPRPAAVLVLGDLASVSSHRPWVLPWSTDGRLAPVRLRRTAETALRLESGEEPGQPRGFEQFARLAFPFALGEQGPFNANGIPAVAISVSGEEPPAPGAAVSADRLRASGRAALRTIAAIDTSRAPMVSPGSELVILNKVLPPWVVRLLVGTLLLPMLVAAIDGLARVRRRKAPLALWLRWFAGLTLPFAASVITARVLGLTHLLVDAPATAVRAGAVPADAAGIAAVSLVFVIAALLVRPLHRLLGARPEPWPISARTSDEPWAGGAPAAALTVTITGLGIIVWLFNPFAAAILVLPAHLWMLAVTPEARLGRAAGTSLIGIALVPALLVVVLYATAVGASPGQLPWSLLLLVAGGAMGPLALAAFCIAGACAVGAFRLARHAPAGSMAPPPATSIRGPLGHTGPGSLGGTQSGFGTRR